MRRALAALLLLVPLSSCGSCRRTFVVPDPGLQRMVEQPRADAFEANAFFDDQKVLQRPPEGTVPWLPPSRRRTAGHPLHTGSAFDPQSALRDVDARVDRPAREVPIPVTPELLVRGRRRYEVHCAPCHGRAGTGETVVALHMELVRPPSLHEERLRRMPPAWTFEVISHGFGLMPSYAAFIEPEDRWAVAFYVQALQLSQHAALDELPEPLRRRALEELP